MHLEREESKLSVQIRRASPKDTPTIVEFNRLLARETENRDLNVQVLDKGVRALFADPTKGMYFLAEENGDVVGQTMITFEWSDWRNGMFWWIQSVYVEKAQRGKGVFRALFEYIRKEAEMEPTVCGLRLYVDHHNERAIKTYDKLGMRRSEYQLMEVDFVLEGRQH